MGTAEDLSGTDKVPESMVFSEEEADRVFDELATLVITLDLDPLAFGPKHLNQKVAEVRQALDRCEHLFLELSKRAHAVKRFRLITAAELDLEKKGLFANDPETRSGRSVSDREAIATGKLRERTIL